ncbi:hypothetical protein JMA_37950 (plasmid) [Jeotgalibacillus malaysiensis]|uniref:Uncharacterized protein n=1 Tax=Jeotgalibacillus malaysiensis TaxID=1508404 RepID=A0A0B5AX10_9BACL|nr:hypothetical protein [Jeotgalibacillus malaysiensis]AJD93113.1 hypothetical protein JMA_37950 [Jeotgalibacillus malaysiensis]
MIPKIALPVIDSEVYYIGNDTEYHKKGTIYRILGSDFHWWKELGYVIWVTTDEYPDANMIDLGMSFQPEEFYLYFRIY